MSSEKGFVRGTVNYFLETRNSILLLILAVALGVSAVLLTPREEEPQIIVPIADVYAFFPGASAEEVETLVATPLEKILWQIDGVEYVYSTSYRDFAVVTVRFYVGEDREDSLVKLYNKINMNLDLVPPGVTSWLVKPVEVDDVPIVNLTIFSDRYDDHELHRMGEELLARLDSVKNISRTGIVGGRRREIRVEIDPDLCAGMNVSPLQVAKTLQGADASLTAGVFERFNVEMKVTTGPFLMSKRDVETLVVGVYQGRPVYVKDVARVLDGPEEVKSYTRFGYGPASGVDEGRRSKTWNAVTLCFAKKKGTNAVWVAEDLIREAERLKKEILPADVHMEVTRDYGETANDKVNELLFELAIAIITVVALVTFGLGWREALVVALSVPVSFSLTLFVSFLLGYTINRVTLFALVLALGLVVDDPIANVDNIQRHLTIRKRSYPARKAAIDAVQEIYVPVLGATLAVIVSFLPMFFITGMMGPYMAPMAANVPLAMLFSLLCALTVVPWLAFLLLHKHVEPEQNIESAGTSGFVYHLYRRMLRPFLDSRAMRWGLLGLVGLLLVGAMVLAVTTVPLKMLPFDNKNEFQLVIDMPEGTTLEQTDRVVKEFERYLAAVPEVTDFQSYVGVASPMDFNGMVRHYYMRRGSHLADIRINLAPKKKRKQQSHAIVLRLRRDLHAIAERNSAALKVVEVPPGPPVISTLTIELYGEPDTPYSSLIEAAGVVKDAMRSEEAVVDIDDTTETPRKRLQFVLDKEKAALHGVTTEQVVQTLYLALSGATPANVHIPKERNPLRVRVVLPRSKRSSAQDLGRIAVRGAGGRMVQLAEIGEFVSVDEDQPIYHKNLKPVVYVFGEMAGRSPVNAILSLQSKLKKHGEDGEFVLPAGVTPVFDGEGEWKITVDVFRDLSISFLAALVGIYIILVIEVKSFRMPLVIMAAIPLTAIGIMPGFALLNLVSGGMVGGYHDHVFFTANGMIGMIALGGIVVRNSILLIEFVRDALEERLPLKEALLRSGGVRFRPIVLVAAAAAFGAWPITLDPIFSALAWALIFGLIASTSFTLFVVPVLYYMMFAKEHERIEDPPEGIM